MNLPVFSRALVMGAAIGYTAVLIWGYTQHMGGWLLWLVAVILWVMAVYGASQLWRGDVR